MTTTPQENPFQTPTAVLQDGPAVATGEPLYRLAAVVIATLFGTPVAGAWVIAQNLKRLGRDAQVRNAWITGIGVFAAILLAALLLPESVPATPFNIAAVIVMHRYAKQIIGDAVEQHAAQGGQFASNWRALGVSLLILAAVMAVVFGSAFVLALLGLI
ncbi:hypothetical protein HNP46_003546 [Pseudomonas nitritireducens]|uniref:Uncharacterized protein n=1 Tax=Pseudomonas nitroreducens TaxID=46680 RepID=A0A7W7KLN8_PSENT|nr:hypothetical protein [Pseudomonas nitritireducens]MBB4864675.1 hypothetical protein [Pseudomonas nitritireducens]